MAVKVYMVESDRFMGQKIDEVKEFDTQEEALAFCTEYDAKHNNLPEAPDWYIRPVMQGNPILSLLGV